MESAYVDRHVIRQNVLQVKVTTTRVLGVLQVVFGVVCVILGITDIASSLRFSYIGTGIWGGTVFVLAGSFGIISASYPTNAAWNNTHMVFAIISLFVALSITVISTLVVNKYIACSSRYDSSSRNDTSSRYMTFSRYVTASSYDSSSRYDTYCYMSKLGLGIHCTLLLTVIAEFAISLTASIMCCFAYTTSCCSCCSIENNGTIISIVPQGHITAPSAVSIQPNLSYMQPVYGHPSVVYTQTSTFNPPSYSTTGVPTVPQTNHSYPHEEEMSNAPY